MKKYIFLLMALVIVNANAKVVENSGEEKCITYTNDFVSDGIGYSIINDEYLVVSTLATIKVYDIIDSCFPPNPYYLLTEPDVKYSGKVTVPESVYVETLGKDLPVREVEFGAFYHCDELESVILPSSVTEIGDFAFHSCEALVSAEVGSQLTMIGDVAFCRCSSLQEIDLPSTLTSLGVGAFYDSGLKSFTIPAGLISLDSTVVDACDNLKLVKSYVVDPWSLWWNPQCMGSLSVKEGCSLEVPACSVNEYKSNEQWNKFRSITAIPDSDDIDFIAPIRSDWVWQYRYLADPVDRYPTCYDTDIIIESEFDECKLIDGWQYRRFRSKAVSSSDSNVVDRTIYGMDYWFRSSYGAVYLYTGYQPFETVYPGASKTSDMSESATPVILINSGYFNSQNLLVYDYGKSKDESYKGFYLRPGSKYELIPADIEIASSSVYSVDNTDLTKFLVDICPDKKDQKSENREVIQQIGSTGFFPFLIIDESISDGSRPKEKVLLTKVYDKKTGKEIYNAPLSVEEISSSSTIETETPVYYNLQGQPVANPVRGEIYILRDSSGSRKVVY